MLMRKCTLNEECRFVCCVLSCVGWAGGARRGVNVVLCSGCGGGGPHMSVLLPPIVNGVLSSVGKLVLP